VNLHQVGNLLETTICVKPKEIYALQNFVTNGQVFTRIDIDLARSENIYLNYRTGESCLKETLI